MKYQLFILFFLLLHFSCNEKNEIHIKQFHFHNKCNELFIKNLNCHFIPLETTENCLISFIDKLYMDNSRIYIIDGKSHVVYAFDYSGKFITQIGNVGQGPSEYIMPMSLYTDSLKQEIVIADASASKLIYYDLNTSQYKKSRSTDYFYECSRLSNGDIAWVSGGVYTTPQRETYYVKVTDANLNLKRYDSPSSFNPEYRLVAGSYFYNYNNQTYLNLPFSPTISQIGPDINQDSYKISVENFNFASKDWLKVNAEKNYMQALTHSDYISAINVKETNRFMSLLFYVGNIDYLCFYDKKTNQSALYMARDFVKNTSLYGLGKTLTVHNNYFVASIEAAALKEHNTKIKELNDISTQIRIDSNPILCLFKFD